MRKLLTQSATPAIRTALLASALILAAGAGTAAQAAPDPAGPSLVNTAGAQEVIRGPQATPGAALGGALVTLAGGGNDLAYEAGPATRPAPAGGQIGTLVNIGGNAEIAYAPAFPAAPRAGG